MNMKYFSHSNTIPVEYYKENLLNKIKKFQIIIVQAETGTKIVHYEGVEQQTEQGSARSEKVEMISEDPRSEELIS